MNPHPAPGPSGGGPSPEGRITPQADVNGTLQFTWSGTLDMTGTTLAGQVGGAALAVGSQIGILQLASTSVFNNRWSLVGDGPGAFGTGEYFQVGFNTTGSSDGNATFAVFDTITLPDGYAGESLQGTVTFADVAYAAAGLTPGTYTWTLLGSGDTVVMTVPGSGVPEIDPAGMGGVLALLTGGFGLIERRRRTHLRERKWRRFSRRAASVVAVSAGGAPGIVLHGAVAGVPQRDIVRGALSVICVGPMFGIVVAVMVLIQVATFELRTHTVRHVLGSDRAESLLPERPSTFLRWLVLGGPVVYGMGVSGITRRVERDGGPQAVTESSATA